ncbi:hypothetical protein ACIQNG_26105 [Streptomyces sp. NPDC091377]|uniref:hypothetical protein n=1 Tax=Streptomyces sp. NPDC091377 TaxID=3365995 RepID=UPI00381C36D8
MSAPLAELPWRVDHLLDRIASNSLITAAGRGTLGASEVPPGYAPRLAPVPLDGLVA